MLAWCERREILAATPLAAHLSGSQTPFGNPFLETPFPEQEAARGQVRETEFQGVRSQTEFGNEEQDRELLPGSDPRSATPFLVAALDGFDDGLQVLLEEVVKEIVMSPRSLEQLESFPPGVGVFVVRIDQINCNQRHSAPAPN